METNCNESGSGGDEGGGGGGCLDGGRRPRSRKWKLETDDSKCLEARVAIGMAICGRLGGCEAHLIPRAHLGGGAGGGV